MKKTAIFFLLLSATLRSLAQGTLTGDFQSNFNSFMKDTGIGAADNPLYDNALSGGEAWLTLRYNTTSGYTFFLRGDLFNNSNLKTPTSPMSDFGIGAWSINKEFGKLNITVGYIYDQIGSGILFRSYEDRGLLIDNALVGAELKYKLSDKIIVKGFTGQQKNNYKVNNSRYEPIIKGLNVEGDFNASCGHLIPGFGVLNRTLDATSMAAVANNINTQALDTRFLPHYNMYAFTAYNTLTYKNFSWYAEAAYKTHEAIYDYRVTSPTYNQLLDRSGNVEYTTLSYGRKGFAINVNAKRTENFVMRTSPNETLLNGMLNWQPVVAVLRPQRLLSRYTPASQDFSEQAASANVNVTPTDEITLNATYTHIDMLDNTKLYREAYVEGQYQGTGGWIFDIGAQYLEYNKAVYQNTNLAYIHKALTPFGEATYRIDEKRSIRAEVEYMFAKTDYGSWAFALVEFNIAPKWSFTLSDMYNTQPNKDLPYPYYRGHSDHYYNVFAAYTYNSTRFTIAYVKQVDGINCAGGVCRYEPAFSGIKGTITSSF